MLKTHPLGHKQLRYLKGSHVQEGSKLKILMSLLTEVLNQIIIFILFVINDVLNTDNFMVV